MVYALEIKKELMGDDSTAAISSRRTQDAGVRRNRKKNRVSPSGGHVTDTLYKV